MLYQEVNIDLYNTFNNLTNEASQTHKENKKNRVVNEFSYLCASVPRSNCEGTLFHVQLCINIDPCQKHLKLQQQLDFK